VLVGKSKHSIDAKGRLTIPSKFREDLGEQFVVSLDISGCLCAYPAAEWEKIRKVLSAIPMFNKELQNFKHAVLNNTAVCELDSMGRILLSQELRETAGITKDVVLLGAFDSLQIWSAEISNEKPKTIVEAYDRLNEEDKKAIDWMGSGDGIPT